MKKCNKCKISKELNEFNKNSNNKDGLQNYCRQCIKGFNSKDLEINRSRWKKSNDENFKLKKEILERVRIEAGGKCEKCNDNRLHVLDFHHKDPNIKENTISEIIKHYGPNSKVGKKKLEKELEKCILLYSNCHRDFHWYENKNSITLEEYLKGNVN